MALYKVQLCVMSPLPNNGQVLSYRTIAPQTPLARGPLCAVDIYCGKHKNLQYVDSTNSTFIESERLWAR